MCKPFRAPPQPCKDVEPPLKVRSVGTSATFCPRDPLEMTLSEVQAELKEYIDLRITSDFHMFQLMRRLTELSVVYGYTLPLLTSDPIQELSTSAALLDRLRDHKPRSTGHRFLIAGLEANAAAEESVLSWMHLMYRLQQQFGSDPSVCTSLEARLMDERNLNTQGNASSCASVLDAAEHSSQPSNHSNLVSRRRESLDRRSSNTSLPLPPPATRALITDMQPPEAHSSTGQSSLRCDAQLHKNNTMRKKENSIVGCCSDSETSSRTHLEDVGPNVNNLCNPRTFQPQKISLNSLQPNDAYRFPHLCSEHNERNFKSNHHKEVQSRQFCEGLPEMNPSPMQANDASSNSCSVPRESSITTVEYINDSPQSGPRFNTVLHGIYSASSTQQPGCQSPTTYQNEDTSLPRSILPRSFYGADPSSSSSSYSRTEVTFNTAQHQTVESDRFEVRSGLLGIHGPNTSHVACTASLYSPPSTRSTSEVSMKRSSDCVEPARQVPVRGEQAHVSVVRGGAYMSNPLERTLFRTDSDFSHKQEEAQPRNDSSSPLSLCGSHLSQVGKGIGRPHPTTFLHPHVTSTRPGQKALGASREEDVLLNYSSNAVLRGRNTMHAHEVNPPTNPHRTFTPPSSRSRSSYLSSNRETFIPTTPLVRTRTLSRCSSFSMHYQQPTEYDPLSYSVEPRSKQLHRTSSPLRPSSSYMSQTRLSPLHSSVPELHFPPPPTSLQYSNYQPTGLGPSSTAHAPWESPQATHNFAKGTRNYGAVKNYSPRRMYSDSTLKSAQHSSYATTPLNWSTKGSDLERHELIMGGSHPLVTISIPPIPRSLRKT